jgi:hypothetical protein
MKKLMLCILAVPFMQLSFAQNNVGIGTVTPDASAALDVTDTDQGMLIPRMALTATNVAAPVAAPATSLLVYNTATAGVAPNDVTPGFYYWDGTQWVRLLNSPSACVTLDDAYNCTTPGGGRIVDVNDGSVEFNQTGGANTEVLTVTTDQGAAGAANIGIFSDHAGVGNAIIGTTNNATADQTFSAVAGSVTNSVTANSGILGLYDGTSAFGSGGSFQATSTDGGVSVFSLNQSPSTASANIATFGNSIGGGTNNYGVQGVVGDGSGALFIWSDPNAPQAGVYGINEDLTIGEGVVGTGYNGVLGYTTADDGVGVYGWNAAAAGPGIGVGVVGEAFDLVTDWGLFAIGDIGATGVKFFVIDHPEDPANKTLKHFCIESDEPVLLYRGTEVVDVNGEVTITLPDYVDMINVEYSYTLTSVGGPAPNLHVAEEIAQGKFKVGGAAANKKVSWVVYGKRNDDFVKNNPGVLEVEVEKTGDQKGRYYDHQTHGVSRSKSIFGNDRSAGDLQDLKKKEVKGKQNSVPNKNSK